MVLKDLDIVYFVKPENENPELQYSLRSVDKNLPHRKVWIYGGCPHGITPDEHINLKQVGGNKWDRVRNMMREVCLNDDITEDFILMNDDFFIMKPIDELPAYTRGSLFEHIVRIEMNRGRSTDYTRALREVVRALDSHGFTVDSYELHIPMILNRRKLLEAIGAFPGIHAARTLYGNYWHLKAERIDDVKIYNGDQTLDKESTFLSTEDNTFAAYPVGRFIRSKFPERSRFEKGNQ